MALTHLGRIANPPHDFTGRELQNIRRGLGLSVHLLARRTRLDFRQIEYFEDAQNGFDKQARHFSFQIHAGRDRLIRTLHQYIMARGPQIDGEGAPARAKRRCGRKPRLMVSTLHL